MDEFASSEHRPPPAWEVKAAIAALALLCLMAIHEGILYLLGRRSPGLSSLQDAWTLLLLLYLGLAAGLLHRSNTAWWLTVGILGSVAILQFVDSLHFVGLGLREERPPRLTGLIDCATRPPVDRFGMFWMAAKTTFLAAAPSLLVLGRLRKSLAASP